MNIKLRQNQAILANGCPFSSSVFVLKIIGLRHSRECYSLKVWGWGIMLLEKKDNGRNFIYIVADFGGFLDFWGLSLQKST